MYTKGFDYIGPKFDIFGIISVNGKPLPKPDSIFGFYYSSGNPQVLIESKQWLKDSKIDEKHMERINEFLKYKKYVPDESFEMAGTLMVGEDDKINIIEPTIFKYLCVFHKEKKDNEYYKMWITNTKTRGYRFNKTFGLYVCKIEKLKMEEE